MRPVRCVHEAPQLAWQKEPRCLWYFYYRCAGPWDDGPCGHKKMYHASEMEGHVWEFVCSLPTDPAQLRADLDVMIEEGRKAIGGDPHREASVGSARSPRWKQNIAAPRGSPPKVT